MSRDLTAASRKLERDALHRRILELLLREAGPGLKPGVLHRTARKAAVAILRWPGSSKDPIHFSTLAAVLGLEGVGTELTDEAILAISRYVIRGKVLPRQRVHELIDESRACWLARCPCRASGRVVDLVPGAGLPRIGAGVAPDGGRAPLVSPERAEALLDALLTVWARPAVRGQTALPLAVLLDRVARARTWGHGGGSLTDLHEATWPYWEILLDHPGYDSCWREGLTHNRKVRELPAELLHPWVDALWEARGILFTGMEAVGTPYALCACPGPEADGGCLLTQWHYFSGNDEVLLPNADLAHGQRKGGDGTVLPCNRIPERGKRPCLGCGCEHDRDW